jgi:hypothetical protein
MAVETAPGYDELSVVAAVDDTLVGVGRNGDEFQAWRLEDDQWRMAGQFGSAAVPASGRLTATLPVGLAAAGDALVALVKADGLFHLWRSLDAGRSWHPLAPPDGPLPAGGGQFAAVVAVPGPTDQIVIVADDHTRGRAWVAAVA